MRSVFSTESKNLRPDRMDSFYEPVTDLDHWLAVLQALEAIWQLDLKALRVTDIRIWKSERELHQTESFQLYSDFQCASEQSVTATGFYFVNHEDIITNLPLCGHDEVNPLLVEPSGLNQVHSSEKVHLFQKFGQLLFPEVPLPISKLHHFQSRGRHLGAFGRPTGSRAGYRHDKGYRKNPVTFIVSSLYRRTSDNPIILQCNLPNSCSDSTNCFLSSVLNVRTFCVTKASRRRGWLSFLHLRGFFAPHVSPLPWPLPR